MSDFPPPPGRTDPPEARFAFWLADLIDRSDESLEGILINYEDGKWDNKIDVRAQHNRYLITVEAQEAPDDA